jgi:hypothetical protein
MIAGSFIENMCEGADFVMLSVAFVTRYLCRRYEYREVIFHIRAKSDCKYFTPAQLVARKSR